MTPTHEDFAQRLTEALRQEAGLAMTMTDTPRELRRWRDNQKRRRATVRIATVAAVAAAIAGIVLGVTLLGGNNKSQPRPANQQHGLFRSTLEPPAALPSSTVVKSLPGIDNVGDFAFGAIWSFGDPAHANHVYRIDPSTGDVLSDIQFSNKAQGSADPNLAPEPFRAGHVMLIPTWAAHASGYYVYDSRGHSTGRFIAATTPGRGAADANGAWIPLTDTTVGRVNSSGHLVRQMRVSSTGITAIGSDGGSLWIGSLGSNDATRIDPATGDVIARVPVGGGAVQILVSPTAVYATTDHFNIVRIDPDTNKVTATAINNIPTNFRAWPALLIAGDGSLWAAPAQGALVELDPKTLSVERGMQVFPDDREGWTAGLAVTGHRAFLGDPQRRRVVSFPLG